MARRKPNPVEDVIAIISRLPWWVGVALALVAYVGLHSFALREGVAVVQPGNAGEFVTRTVFRTLAGVGQYLLPAVFLVGAGLSAYGRHTRRTLHRTVATGPDHAALNKMSWKKFEALVGEAFRRRGYSVTETGGDGPDSGADLALKKGGELFLVHCKQWRTIRVGVSIVRELYGAMTARGATGGFVVTSGVFTDEALAFAKVRNIELMDGKALHALISGVSVPPRFFRDPLSITTSGAPFCPECQSRMVKRKAKRGTHAGQMFWTCSRHPDCRGRRPA
ncbi:restriction endonuclease [Thiobacillus sp.]